MSYLLDSHTFIWALLDRTKLSSTVIEILEDTTQEVFVSAVSFRYISLKYRLGKLDLTGVVPGELPLLAKERGFDVLPLAADEASTYRALQEEWHRDPFDRMLIRQAILHNLILLSKYKNIRHYRAAGLKQLW